MQGNPATAYDSWTGAQGIELRNETSLPVVFGPTARDCVADADCGPGNVCIQSTCAANGPPVADFLVPSDPTTHRLLAFAPAARDPEGRPVSLRWEVAAERLERARQLLAEGRLSLGAAGLFN